MTEEKSHGHHGHKEHHHTEHKKDFSIKKTYYQDLAILNQVAAQLVHNAGK